MTFPTPHKIGHHVWSAGAVDDYNVPADVYTPPADQPGKQVAVISWRTHTTEPDQPGHNSRVITEGVVCTPPTFVPAQGDLLDLPGPTGGQFEVLEIGDENHGFHGWTPGFKVKVRKVTG